MCGDGQVFDGEDKGSGRIVQVSGKGRLCIDDCFGQGRDNLLPDTRIQLFYIQGSLNLLGIIRKGCLYLPGRLKPEGAHGYSDRQNALVSKAYDSRFLQLQAAIAGRNPDFQGVQRYCLLFCRGIQCNLSCDSAVCFQTKGALFIGTVCA